MPIHYQIEPDLDFLFTIFHGTVTKHDAFDYSVKVNKDPNNMYTGKTLVILKESKLIFNIEDVETFSRKMSRNKSFKYRNKIALLIESPTDTVAATIYAQTLITMRRKVSIELFYTLEKALKFLELSDKQSRINEILAQVPKEVEALKGG